MPQHSSFDFLVPSPNSSKHLEMYSNVWNESKRLIHSEGFMGIPQETGDTPAHPRSGKRLSTQGWWTELGCTDHYQQSRPFVLSVLVVLRPLFSDLFSNLLQTLLGPGRRWSSLGINGLLVLWLEASKGTHRKVRQTEESEAAFFHLSAVVWRCLPSPLPWLCQLSPRSKGLQQHWASCSYFRPQAILTPLAASPWTIHPPLLVPKTMFLSNSFIKLSGNKVSQPQVPSVSCLDPV